jgi:hypothetical protein
LYHSLLAASIAIKKSFFGVYPAFSIALTINLNASSSSFKLGAYPPSSPTPLKKILSSLRTNFNVKDII